MATDWVASVDLIAVTSAGEETRVTAAIGHPYQRDDGEWRCPVRLSGLYDRLADMAGADSIQALCMAASLLRALLESVNEEGGKILAASDRSEYNVPAVFGRVGRQPGTGSA